MSLKLMTFACSVPYCYRDWVFFAPYILVAQMLQKLELAVGSF